MVKATDRLADAKLLGVKDDGICAWFGGYSFNVYNPVTWQEIDHFTSGELAGDVTENRKEVAAKRMEMSGYNPVI